MFEEISKKNSEWKHTITEAMSALAQVQEPHKSKIMAAFHIFDFLSKNMSNYKEVDSMMDDAASELTALTGVDVRKEGACKALEKAMRHGSTAQIVEAFEDFIKWHIANYLKLKSENE